MNRQEQRRARYANDPVYRAAEQARVRAAYADVEYRDRQRIKQKAYRKTEKYKLDQRARKKALRSTPEFKAARQKKRKTDISERLSLRLRHRLYFALLKNIEANRAVRDLGCSIAEFKAYIEAQFLPGMSWDNHDFYGWHLDHIRPLASFDLTNREELRLACYYTNYQPLWAKDNLRKGAR